MTMVLRFAAVLIAVPSLVGSFAPPQSLWHLRSAGWSSSSPCLSSEVSLLGLGVSSGVQECADWKLRRASALRASASSAPDPFRPARHPLDPVVINILQKALFSKPAVEAMSTLGSSTDSEATEQHLEAVLSEAKQRRVDGELDESERLSLEEWALIESRTRAVVSMRPQLEKALLEATNAHPWIAKFKSGGDFGLPLDDGPPATALVALNRCECMLALWMLHVDNLDVLFVDEDRLEVLRHASARDVLI